jgi:hypothetical protein
MPSRHEIGECAAAGLAANEAARAPDGNAIASNASNSGARQRGQAKNFLARARARGAGIVASHFLLVDNVSAPATAPDATIDGKGLPRSPRAEPGRLIIQSEGWQSGTNPAISYGDPGPYKVAPTTSLAGGEAIRVRARVT